MNSNLNQLIEFWEQKKQKLELELENCINERDFEFAEYYSNSLNQISQKLRVLRSLDQNNQWNIDKYKQDISKIENEILISDSERKKFILEYRLRNLHEQLNQLEENKNEHFEDAQKIDELLFDLYDKKINGFRIYLSKDENVYLGIEVYDNKILEIKLTKNEYIKNNKWINSIFEKRLRIIGFRYDFTKERLVLCKEIPVKIDTIEIKMFLSRIVYECYHELEIDNPMIIEVY